MPRSRSRRPQSRPKARARASAAPVAEAPAPVEEEAATPEEAPAGERTRVRSDAPAVFRSPQVVLFSSDLAATAAFYTGLGFRETFRVPQDGDPIHVDLELDGYRLGLATVESTRDDHGLEPVPHGQRAAVVLWTDDTETAYHRLVREGVPSLAAPHVWLGRLHIAWVSDPDGHPVQIVERL